MNASLMNFVTKWMSDYDREKEKEEDRKYREQQIEQERSYEGAKETDRRKYNEGREEEERRYSEKKIKETKDEQTVRELEAAGYNSRVPIKANSWEKYQETGQIFNPTADDYLHRPAIAQAMQAANLNAQASPIESKQRYSIAVKQATEEAKIVRDAIGAPKELTDEQVAILYPNRSATEGLAATTALEGIRQGLPAQRVGAEREALNLSTQTALRGGREPWQAVNDRMSVVKNPTTGGYTIRENPIAPTDDSASVLGGMVSGNNMLKNVATQLGLPKYPWEQDAQGNLIQRKRPATATPAAEKAKRDSLFGGNLAVGPDEVINYGKITPEEALKAQGLIVNKDGTISAPKKERAPLGFSNRDSGFSGMVNLVNPNSPYNIVNRIYGSQGMGIGDAYVTGTRQLTEEEKELERQKARKVLNKVY